MKLTRKKAIELCIELWTWLAKTGKHKEDWPRWPEIEKKYGLIMNNCFFCEITHGCAKCPYYQIFGHCDDGVYNKWDNAKTPRIRKKYAKLFLEQIRELK